MGKLPEKKPPENLTADQRIERARDIVSEVRNPQCWQGEKFSGWISGGKSGENIDWRPVQRSYPEKSAMLLEAIAHAQIAAAECARQNLEEARAFRAKLHGARL